MKNVLTNQPQGASPGSPVYLYPPSGRVGASLRGGPKTGASALRLMDARRSGQDNRRGVVLIIVLVLVVMIAFAGFSFVSEMTTEYEATKINGDLLQAQQVMASAEAYLLAHVDRQQQTSDDPSAFADSDDSGSFQAITLKSFGETAGNPEQGGLADTEWRFAVVRDPASFDAQRQGNGSTAGDGLEQLGNLDAFTSPEFGLSNESSKLNLGRVLYWDSMEPGRGRRALLQIPGMTNEAADSILDWIDLDDTPRQFGAEADHYRQQQRNIKPRNGIPETLTELLLVRGVSRNAFFGSGGVGDLGSSRGWNHYLTLTSAESTVASPPKIAINDLLIADMDALEKELARAVPEEVARYVALTLMVGISASTDQLQTVGPLAVELNRVTVQSLSANFALTDLIDSSIVLTGEKKSQRVESPLKSTDPESLRILARLEQLMTIVDTSLAVLRGRVDILTASEEVLRALTDDPAAASQIVQQRESLSEDERASSAWLLARRIVDLSTYRHLYPDITTGGDVYSGEILVYRPVGGPFLRRKITIDAANGSARRINWLDKSSLPLPLTLRQLEPFEGEILR